MKENKFRFLKGGAVATLVALTAISPVFAATGMGPDTVPDTGTTEEEEESTITTKTEETTVTYSGVATYTVNIPKTIVLGSEKKANYTVTVTGDTYEGVTVSVVPDETFEMTTTGKDAVTATVSLDKKSWTYADVKAGTEGNGEISAQGLTSGNWEGKFNFTISVASPSTGGAIVPPATLE